MCQPMRQRIAGTELKSRRQKYGEQKSVLSADLKPAGERRLPVM